MKVFLSYRREDSPAVVDRVAERLRRKLGPGNVFKDVDSVSAGENFLDKVQTALTAADVLLLVIGPGWLNASKRPGKRRLDDPDDWVRIEVHEALQRDDVRVVPLLVEGATMPGELDLPPGLKALAYRQACILRPDPMLEADLDTLCERLDPVPEAESKASALRAVDIPNVTAAGGGIQQAHTAVSPRLKRPVVFVLAAVGLAILAIALLIVSQHNTAPPMPPKRTGPPKSLPSQSRTRAPPSRVHRGKDRLKSIASKSIASTANRMVMLTSGRPLSIKLFTSTSGTGTGGGEFKWSEPPIRLYYGGSRLPGVSMRCLEATVRWSFDLPGQTSFR